MTNNPVQMLQGLMASPAGQIFAAFRRGGNPVQLMQQMAGSSPQVAQALQIINGKSPQQLQQIATNMARERGLDVSQIMQGLGLGR